MASGDEQLISFISKAREKGRSDEQIARSLYSVGWRKERVDGAFMAADEKAKGAAPGAGQADAPEELQEKEEQQEERVRLSTSTPRGAPSSQPQTGRITPPAKPAAMQPQRTQGQQPAQGGQQYPMQQPSQQEGQPERKIPMLPTIPPAQAHAPIELPHGPDYPEVHDESQVQNPAFPKVAGGVSKLDLEFIVRVLAFLIILGAVIGAYFYITGGNSPIAVSS